MRTLVGYAALVCGVVAMMGNVQAADDKVDLKVGDKAPSFTALDDSGKPFNSEDVVGKKIVVVYFYPADFTGGCTKQACGFRDDMTKLASKDVVVIGVSCDSVATHAAFKKHHKLNFTLLADEKGEVARKFGVPLSGKGGTAKGFDLQGNEATFKRENSAARWTFVIGKDGRIAMKNTKVSAADDSKAVLEAIEKLAK
ncbi:MAG: peroxiredoxin [Gemmataceae bacterium]|nr:peroxiredoxin [Gemmataceae bacterium]MDW8264737.1 peroxiredoxin [Gemmataceae bacterium]